MHKPYHPAAHPSSIWGGGYPEQELCSKDKSGGLKATSGEGARASLTPLPESAGDELGLIARSLLEQAQGMREILSELRTLTKHVKRAYGI